MSKRHRHRTSVEVEVEIDPWDVLSDLDADTLTDLVDTYATPLSFAQVAAFIEQHLWLPDEWERLQQSIDAARVIRQRRNAA